MDQSNTTSATSGSLIDKVKALAEGREQLIKYFLIGATASAIDLILYFVIYNGFKTTELFAQSISVPTAIVFSFVVNARHNFKTNDYALIRFVSFCIVCLIGYAAGLWVIWGVQGFFENQMLGGNIGKVVSLPVVFVIQYILNSKITFRKVQSDV